MKLLSSPLERQQNCYGKIQLCGNSGFHSLTSKGRSQSVQSHTPIFSNPSHARSLMNLAAAWLLGCGFLCSSLSKGEETVDDSAKKENSHEAGQGITIVKALYGSREQFATGDAKDVTEKAREYVADGTLHIPHTRQAFGDPHPYKSKILRLTYLVHGKGDAFGQPYVMERPAGLVNLLVPEIDGNRPLIKHVNLGKGAYCTSASILMALQHTTGMDLSSEALLSVLASIRSAACGSGKLGNKVDGFCEILNIESKELEYNIQAIEQRQEQEAFAKNKLLEEIVPFLHKGCAVMVINSERGLSHAVLATSYDSSSKNFVIHDPLKQGAEIWSISKLAKCWPRDLNGVMLLRSQLIVNQEFHNKVLVPLPANKEIDVMVSELVKIMRRTPKFGPVVKL